METNVITPKFKRGDEIFFMKDNKPVKRKISGISVLLGEIKTLQFDKEEKEQDHVVYYTGPYEEVKEIEVFKSEDELKKSLFEPLKETNS